jgi:hypothetical protein
MSWGEMTITVDNVLCLLHLLIKGEFNTLFPCINDEEVVALLEKLCGIYYDMAKDETRKQRGGYYNQEWTYYVHQMHLVDTSVLLGLI